MDDLKLFAKNDKELEEHVNIVKEFSSDLDMDFEFDKCAKATLKSIELIEAQNIELDITTVIRNLEQSEVYKYLGVNEGDGIEHSNKKERIHKECYRKVRMLPESKLNAANN